MAFYNKFISDSLPIRNETGSTLSRGRFVAVVGFSVANKLPLVDYADKDDLNRRPAIGILTSEIANNSNGFVVDKGRINGLDTSSLSLTDQLVLGNNGLFLRPPPDQDPFTGEIQGIGSVSRVDSTNGEIILAIDKLDVLNADAVFNVPQSTGRGLESGGELNNLGGLILQIESGVGFVTDGSGNLKRIVWNTQNIVLPANSSRFISINNAGSTFVSSIQPSGDENILLGNVKTDSSNIVLISAHNIALTGRNAGIHLFFQETVGSLTVSGGKATVNGVNPLKFDVDSSTFWLLDNRRQVEATTSGAFTYWYRDGLGGWNTTLNNTQVDPNNYDTGSGVLFPVPSGQYKKDLLFIVSPKRNATDVQHHVVYGQETFSSQAAAIDGNLPTSPDDLTDFSLRSAGIITQANASGISAITDVRPFLGQQSPNTSSVTDHHNLNGLGHDDHLQYILTNGTRAFTGNIDAGSNSLINVNLVDGRDVSIDGTKLDTIATNAAALTSSAPVDITKAAAVVGVSTTAARADHKHNISTATPVAIGTANSEGTATSLTRSDHVHDHGSQPLGAGTNHAVATVTVAGFMSATDKVKVNNAVVGPTSATDNAVAVFSGVSGQVVKNSLVTIDGSGNVTASGTYNGVNVASHATRHSNGGADQVNAQNLGSGATASGLLLETSGAGAWNLKATNTVVPESSIQEATGTITTTSATDVLATSMTVTPTAGIYMVWFSATVQHSANDRAITTSIYSGGVQVASSERTNHANDNKDIQAFSCIARVTVNGSQAIEGRWRTTAATASMYQRSLAIVKVS